MKLLALVDIHANGTKYEAGSEFETSAETGSVLIEYGWAEAVEEVKAPKKAAKKK
jgi:hypothetical protein